MCRGGNQIPVTTTQLSYWLCYWLQTLSLGQKYGEVSLFLSFLNQVAKLDQPECLFGKKTTAPIVKPALLHENLNSFVCVNVLLRHIFFFFWEEECTMPQITAPHSLPSTQRLNHQATVTNHPRKYLHTSPHFLLNASCQTGRMLLLEIKKATTSLLS